MAEYLKRASRTAQGDQADVTPVVRALLAEIAAGGEAAARDMARRFDGWEGEVVVPDAAIAAAIATVSDRTKADIRFAHDNIRRFAEAQKSTIHDVELEILPGLIAGQKQIPVGAAGCYVPGGRYAHVASAIMTITTARVAGVGHITACSPARGPAGIPPDRKSVV